MLMCTPADLAVLHTLANLIIQVSPLAVHWPAANSYGGTECNQPVGLDLRSLSTNRKSSALTKSTRWYTASPSAAQVFPRPVLFADTSIITNSDGDVVASKLRRAAGTAGMSPSIARRSTGLSCSKTRSSLMSDDRDVSDATQCHG